MTCYLLGGLLIVAVIFLILFFVLSPGLKLVRIGSFKCRCENIEFKELDSAADGEAVIECTHCRRKYHITIE